MPVKVQRARSFVLPSIAALVARVVPVWCMGRETIPGTIFGNDRDRTELHEKRTESKRCSFQRGEIYGAKGVSTATLRE